MFSLAIFIGIYSYLILALGLLSWLTKPTIIIVTFLFFLGFILYTRKTLSAYLPSLMITVSRIKKNKTFSTILLLLFLLAVVNFMGALGPELAFDALWYHLTLPKIYIIDHAVHFISGGLLYYSGMPQLTEMFYTAALGLESEIMAKIIHFLFGILATIALYKLSQNYFNKTVALLAALIFYSNLVVDWESTTAYIDLARTFFEIMALWGFVNWVSIRDRKWFIQSAVMLGLAVCTKTLALGSLVIFIVLIVMRGHQNKHAAKEIFENCLLYACITMLIPLPWFFLTFLNTGNPFYPLFTNYEIHQTIGMVINPIRFIHTIWQVFIHAPDPLSPIYLIFLPLLFFHLFRNYNKNTKKNLKITTFPFIIIYSILAILIWYITPQTGGGRFIMPYLPALSLVTASVFVYRFPRYLHYLLISVVFFIACVSIFYRGVANSRYLPVIFGRETKTQFLKDHLNFSFGDFYDIDGYLAKKVKPNETVLLYGFHNIYYIDFPFIDNSWVKPGDRFTYVATQNMDVPPKRFKSWNLIYLNQKTGIKLYTFQYHTWIY